ncbi:unnamed protein product [Effrenium voratum]|nr:unnamed protein product [Effrenium voratum]
MFSEGAPPKRARGGERQPLHPELLVLVLDARLLALEVAQQPAFPAVWESLLLFLRAFVALNSDQKAVMLLAADTAVALSEIETGPADWEAARRKLLEAPAVSTPCTAAALGCGLCLAQRQLAQNRQLQARVLVIDASSSEVDYTQQSAGLVSCAFAAKSQGILIDVLAVNCGDFLLRQVSLLAEGKFAHLPNPPKPGQPPLAEALAPLMLFHFLASRAVRKQLAVATDQQHLPAVCLCHQQPQAIGYVCSCCLAIYCSDASAICQCCGTRFKRHTNADPKIKDGRFLEEVFEDGRRDAKLEKSDGGVRVAKV